MVLDRDTLVFVLLGALVALEILGRLAVLLLPDKIILWRQGRWWRWLRVVQAVILLGVFATLFDVLRNPASPPGKLERWMEQAGFLVRDTWDDFSRPGPQLAAINRNGLHGRVTSVIDGDSLRIRLAGGGRWEARLYGIDAPEHDQPHGAAAERALARKLLWRAVDIEVVDIDSYGRQVVLLYRRGKPVNYDMVCEGHAWWYVRYAPDDSELEGCQRLAQVQKLGLWASGIPIPPWEWRRGAEQVPE